MRQAYLKDWKEKDVIYGLIQPSKMNTAIALLLCRQSKKTKRAYLGCLCGNLIRSYKQSLLLIGPFNHTRTP